VTTTTTTTTIATTTTTLFYSQEAKTTIRTWMLYYKTVWKKTSKQHLAEQVVPIQRSYRQ